MIRCTQFTIILSPWHELECLVDELPLEYDLMLDALGKIITDYSIYSTSDY